MGSNRVLFACDSLKVGRVVPCGQSDAGRVPIRGSLIEVEQFQRSPLFVECPNASPFHSEHPASRFGDHPQRLFEIPRIDSMVLRQLAQRNLLLFQRARPLSFNLFALLAFGNIFRDAEQILGCAIVAVDRDFLGVEQPPSLLPSFDRLFRNIEEVPALQYLAIHGREKVGFLLGEKVIIAFADEFRSRLTEQLFTRLVEAHKLEGLGILDENHVRNIFDDGGQERLIVFCFFRGSFAFRNVSINAVVSSEPAGTIEHGHSSAFKDDAAAVFM